MGPEQQLEPRKGYKTKPMLRAWVNGTTINPESWRGDLPNPPDQSLPSVIRRIWRPGHCGTEENRRMLRATGCQGGRTGGVPS